MNLEVYLTKIVEVIALMIGWYTFRNLPHPIKLIVYYISFSVVTNILAEWFALLFGNNYILFHFYTPLELIIITITILLIIESKKLKMVSIFILIPYLSFWAISKFTFESLNQVDNVTSTIASTIILFLAVYGILKITLSSFGSIWHDPKIITLFGILIYFGGNLFVMALSNLIFSRGHDDAIILWKIHNVLYICLDVAFAYSFYLYEWKPDKVNA